VTELTRQQLDLLAVICANNEARLVVGRRVRLPNHVSKTVNNLRRLGLVEQQCFRPTSNGLETLKARLAAADRDTRRSPAPKAREAAGGRRVDQTLGRGVPARAGGEGARPVPQRPDRRAGESAPAPLVNLAPADRADGVGHRRLEGGSLAPVAPPPPAAQTPARAAEKVESLLPAPDVDRDDAPFRRKPDEQICAEVLAHQEEQRRIEAMRLPMDLDAAKAFLLRKGRTVYSAKVVGGPADRFIVSGLGERVSRAELIAEAERVRAGRPKE
jgi:hypothetical protein